MRKQKMKKRELDTLRLADLVCRYLKGEIKTSDIEPETFGDKITRQRAAFIRAFLELLEEGKPYLTPGEIAERANNYLGESGKISLKGAPLGRLSLSALKIASVASKACKDFFISVVVGNKNYRGRKPPREFYEMVEELGYPIPKIEEEQKKVHQFFKERKKKS